MGIFPTATNLLVLGARADFLISPRLALEGFNFVVTGGVNAAERSSGRDGWSDAGHDDMIFKLSVSRNIVIGVVVCAQFNPLVC